MDSDSDLSSTSSTVNPFFKERRASEADMTLDDGISLHGTKRKASALLQGAVSDNSESLPLIAENAPPPTRKSTRVVPPRGTSQMISSSTETLSKPTARGKAHTPSWADPKSKDWDVIRVLSDDNMLADDWLSRPAKPKYNYCYANGKLKEPLKYEWFVGIPHVPEPNAGVHLPLAGRIIDDSIHPEANHPEIAVLGNGEGSSTPVTSNARSSGEGPSTKRGAPARKVRRTTKQVEALKEPAATIEENTTTSTKKTSTKSTGDKLNLNESASNIPSGEKLIKKVTFSSSVEVVLFAANSEDKIYSKLLIESDEKEENFHAKPSIKLNVPDHIKAILVDDWENVTKNQQLVPIPAKHSVTMILEDYLEYEKPNRLPGTALREVLEEVVAGLKVYFDRCLGRILLYRFERNQYVEAIEGWNSPTGELAGKTAADTYGAEHLARLLVTLPELIAQTNMDQPSVNRLRVELTTFTNWLGRNATTYFVSEYEQPSPEYVEKARGVY